MIRTGARGAALLTLATLLGGSAQPQHADPHAEIRGVTLSTPTYGQEWGHDSMVGTIEVLDDLGANWIAYHPYARITGDGRVLPSFDPRDPPSWVTRPIEEAHAKGLKVLVKPHLAHWGSPFSWRGEIQFEDPATRERFFEGYTAWIRGVAEATQGADAFVVGTELGGTVAHEDSWRAVIAEVRKVHTGQLTYAANWDRYAEVPFWDALDAIGIQAYFPLVTGPDDPTAAAPTPQSLRAAWKRVLVDVHTVSRATGKPVVFTEIGYDASPQALDQPWASGRGREDLQQLALAAALDVIAEDPIVRGAFLWKWFPGELQAGDFRMSSPPIRALLAERWR